ncbi:MAG: hypothetical protein QW638_01635 [Candidatus Bathyarchaeia archaeon]|nr:hypothetical protein [Candidatus Bathyarchaeota archaeon]
MRSLADEVKDFIQERYVKPARDKGSKTITLKAGEIQRGMGLKGKIPTICSALSSKKLQEICGIRLLKKEGPSCGSEATFTYEIQ